jgi:hypothetical protein
MPKYTDKQGMHIRRARWNFGSNETGTIATVDVLVPVTERIAVEGAPEDVLVGFASEAQFKAYAQRLLKETE